MNFTAPAFVLLFPIVLALHWMLPPSRRWVLLLAASLGFYAVGSPQALPLLAGITLGTYAAALGIAKSKTQTAKKLWLTCAAVLCIGCLCLFKYAGIFRTDVPLLLPAGISFYTFQTLSYVIDIYRGRLMPERHPGYYALFVSFFPQLVAGPIERSTALLPQLHAQERRMDSSGWLWMVRGFAKKLLLADTAAVFVDSVYASPADASGPAVLLATLLFAGQIYWDFSGYSDMAIGMGRCMGFHFDENFNYPYVTRTITEFWRRWHISLGSFFRDYVYIPMGGNRRHQPLNILVVWFLTGLWHGASWNFVLWGLYFGAIIMLEKYTIVKIQDRIPGFILHIYSLFIIVFGWVIFYFTDISRMGGFIGILFGGGASGWNLVAQNELTGNLWLIIAGIVCCLPIGKGIRSIYEKAAYDGSVGAEVLLTGAKTLCAAALLVSCTLLLIGSTTNPFLYLRF